MIYSVRLEPQTRDFSRDEIRLLHRGRQLFVISATYVPEWMWHIVG